MDMKKMTIYQVFPRLFGNRRASLVRNGNLAENGVGKFSAFTPAVLRAIKELGITHVWYTGVIEHATQADYTAYGIRKDHSAIVKGKAGSPYAIKDYYDVDPDLADHVPSRMEEFESLVERTHTAGMKVIIDFVPNHVARQYHSDARLPYVKDLGQHDNTLLAFDVNNNFYYIPHQPLMITRHMQDEDFEYSEFPARATGNNRFDPFPCEHDWYETIKLNYGVNYQAGVACFCPLPDTWTKMLDILLFWVGRGVDGFRCDMAEMVPVEFWEWVIPEVKKARNVCFIAEVYNPAEYRNYLHRGHFDYLYDKVGLYDTLRAVTCGHAPASDISKTWQAVEGIQPNMLHFLENHDEQRIASTFFAGNARAGIPAMIVAATLNTNPVMIYNGQELGERGMDDEGYSGCDGRTTIYDYWSMESIRNWLNQLSGKENSLTEEQSALRATYARLLNLTQTEPAITQGLFHDLMYANTANPQFDPAKQYAFLRKHGNEVILCIANFDTKDCTTAVYIPSHAFEALSFGDNKPACLTDLLTGDQSAGTLTSAYPYRLPLPPQSAKLLKFTFES
ncbi:MAG: alpha-amylase [Tannerellaceae bacterium]|jgi:glycosidase|nr:alpha-amylase [Tannerellaceae bacterium]